MPSHDPFVHLHVVVDVFLVDDVACHLGHVFNAKALFGEDGQHIVPCLLGLSGCAVGAAAVRSFAQLT